MLSVEGIIAIISVAGASIALIIKLISIACFKSKCNRVKCCCMEIERDIKNEIGNMTFDDNNNIHSIESKPQDIHININDHHSNEFKTSELKTSPNLPIRKLEIENNNIEL
jgi:uncharacterized membrane protein YvbJ